MTCRPLHKKKTIKAQAREPTLTGPCVDPTRWVKRASQT
jgi:hypothetical protein